MIDSFIENRYAIFNKTPPNIKKGAPIRFPAKETHLMDLKKLTGLAKVDRHIINIEVQHMHFIIAIALMQIDLEGQECKEAAHVMAQ